MKINLMHLGMLQTNCYLIETSEKNVIVIDAGATSDFITSFLEKNKLKAKMILLTHGHYDHVGAITQLKAETGATIAIHEADNELLLNPDLVHHGITAQLKGYTPAPADRLLKDGDEILLDDVKLKVMHTPGHSKGSCIFTCESDNIIFTGDTIFQDSVGRSDLYGGSEKVLMDSIKKIASIEGEYVLLPGHGDSTQLSKEKITNPFMGNNYDDIF